MKSRILSLLLAVAILLSMQVTALAADGEADVHYAVSASADVSIGAGETAQVQVTVSSDDADTYNDYDLILVYDTDKLTYISAAAADSHAAVIETDGKIRVIGYGEAKSVDTAAVTLTFTGKSTGSAEVKIADAKVDIDYHAISHDAPNAEILDDTTVITVAAATATYPVTVEGTGKDDVTAAEQAVSGTDYTFTVTKEAGYTYAVSVTIGGASYDLGAPDANGTYTIPGADITGDIVITVTKTEKNSCSDWMDHMKDWFDKWFGSTDKPHIHRYTCEVTKKPTCTEQGEKTFTCDCGNSYTVAIPAVGHRYENGICSGCGAKNPAFSGWMEIIKHWFGFWYGR